MRVYTMVLSVLILNLLSSSDSMGQVTFSTPDTCVQTGDTIWVDFNVENFSDIATFQSSFQWDSTVFSYLDVGNFGISLNLNNDFNFNDTSQGRIGVGFFRFPTVSIPDGGALFSVQLVVTGSPGSISDFIITNQPVSPVEATQGIPPVPIGVAPAVGSAFGTLTVNGPPTALCQDITIALDAMDSTATIAVSQVDAGTFDPCDLDSVTLSQTFFDINDIGANPVDLIAYDALGFTDTCEATVSVLGPGGGPAAVCLDITIQLDAMGADTITPADLDGGSTGTGTLNFAISQSTFNCTDVGDNSVILSITDDIATSTCTSIVTVEDDMAPTVTCTDVTLQLDANGAAVLDPASVEGTITDNCSIAMSSVSQDMFDCDDIGTQTITLTVTDDGGNTATCEAQVEVEDALGPNMACQDVTVQLDANGMASITVNNIDNGTNDNCGTPMLSLDITSFGCNDLGSNAVILTGEDNGGNSADCTAQVTVEDTIPPVAVCQDITVQLDSINQVYTLPPADVDGGSSDNCGIDMQTVAPNTFDIEDLGDNSVELSVQDAAGNMDTCSAVFTLLPPPGFGPTAVCQDITVQLNASGEAAVSAILVDNGSFGEGTLIYTLNQNMFTCADIGDNAVILTVEDDFGTDACSATITIIDANPPVALCQDVTLNVNVNGEAELDVEMIDAGSTDNCGVDSLGLSQSDFTCADIGTNMIELVVFDSSGNTGSCVAQVVVQDVDAPVALCQGVNVFLDENGQTIVTAADIDGGSSDNCGIATMQVTPSSFTCDDIGMQIVELLVIDETGNSSTCTADVSVQDIMAPEMNCQDITVQLNGGGIALIAASDLDGGVTDNCEFDLSIQNSSFDCNDIGENQITLTATDGSGSVATCESTVTVEDDLPPSIFCEDVTVSLDTSGQVVVDPLLVGGLSSDNCQLDTLILSPAQFDCNQIGQQPVELYVIDVSGNADTCSAQVTVVDDAPPVAVCVPVDVYLGTDGTADLLPSMVDGGSTDNCGIANTSLDNLVFDCSSIGMQTVVLTVEDVNGNNSTCQSTVTVSDTLAPEALCTDITVNIGVNGVVNVNPDAVGAGSMDNCGAPTLSVDPSMFTCDDIGDQLVTLTAADDSGNMSTCSATVTVDGSTELIANCLDATIEIGQGGIAVLDPNLVYGGGGDVCGSTVNVAVAPNQFACNDVGENLVILTISDNDGNSATCNATVTVEDNLPPNAFCQNLVVQLDPSGKVAVTPAQINNNSSDNCGAVDLVSLSQEVFFCEDVGSNSVTLTISDNNNNEATCTGIVTVQDITPPVAECKNTNVEIGAGGIVNVNPQLVGDNSTDNCGDVTLSLSLSTFNCNNIGVQSVTLTVTDESGNTDDCTANITVRDLPSNSIQCKPGTVSLGANGTYTLTPLDVLTALPITDCNQLTISLNKTDLQCKDLGLNSISVNVSDAIGTILNCVSSINVQDNLPPVANCQDVTLQIGVNGTVNLNPDLINNGSSDNCGISDISVSQSAFDCSDIGTNLVTLTVNDENGNANTCTANVFVEGGANLNAVCTDIAVDLDENGTIEVLPEMVDAGSISDCGDPILSLSQTNFDCSDIGLNALTLTVSNSAGNTATCTANVIIQDVMPPFLICQDLVIDLGPNGTANILPTDVLDMINSTDNCGPFIVQTASPNFFDCTNLGDNPVAVMVVDNNGNENSCVATVTVNGGPGLSLSATVSTTSESSPGAMDGTATAMVTGGSGNYTFEWDNPANSTTQVVSNLSAGLYTVTVTDDQSGCETTATGFVGLGGDVTFSADSVSGEAGQMIDVPVRVSNFASVQSFQFSVHVNNNSVADIVEINDLAIPGIMTNITNNDITVEWADPDSSGVTLPDNAILFNIKVNLVGNPGNSTLVTLDGNPLAAEAVQNIGGTTQIASVELNNGLISILNLMDLVLSGTCVTELSLPVKNVDVALTGTTSGFMETPSQGTYSFTVPFGSTQNITPFKDTFYLNGVTTFDLVLITQHILGVQLLGSPYKIIAADATNDGVITTFDVVEFRKLILQIVPALPNNNSWRFVRSSHNFPNPTNPFTPPFPEDITYNNIMQDQPNGDFISVKIGDVTDDVNSQAFTSEEGEERYNGSLNLQVFEKAMKAGEVIEYPVYAADFEKMLGLQLALALESAGMELVDVIPGALPDFTPANINMLKEKGEVLMSWISATPVSLNTDQPLFTLVLKANDAVGNVADLIAISDKLLPEAYTADLRKQHIDIDIIPELTSAEAFKVFPNKPNPFNTETKIGFNLPEGAKVSLSVFNGAGELVMQQSQIGSQGYNEFVVTTNELPDAGIYFYKVATRFGSEVGKMVFLK